MQIEVDQGLKRDQVVGDDKKAWCSQVYSSVFLLVSIKQSDRKWYFQSCVSYVKMPCWYICNSVASTHTANSRRLNCYALTWICNQEEYMTWRAWNHPKQNKSCLHFRWTAKKRELSHHWVVDRDKYKISIHETMWNRFCNFLMFESRIHVTHLKVQCSQF